MADQIPVPVSPAVVPCAQRVAPCKVHNNLNKNLSKKFFSRFVCV